jgi:hypothetical protein
MLLVDALLSVSVSVDPVVPGWAIPTFCQLVKLVDFSSW